MDDKLKLDDAFDDLNGDNLLMNDAEDRLQTMGDLDDKSEGCVCEKDVLEDAFVIEDIEEDPINTLPT